jgi:hypothetical protein
MSTTSVVDHGSTRTGRWLQQRRFRIALWIAVVEAILVAVFHDISRWTVVGVAIVAVVAYLFKGREARSVTVRQVSWILAFSQALAVLAVILSVLFFWMALIAAVVFAAIALFVLFTDK